MEETKINWQDEAIKREATPKVLRELTVKEFCDKHGVPLSTYYWFISKDDTKKDILRITLNKAKESAPEVLEVLVKKAEEGDMKAIDMYMDMILQLSKNLDLKTNGLSLVFDSSFKKDATTPETKGNSTE